MGTHLVTGASGGIGQAIAQHLAANGHQLVLAARRRQPLIELVDKLPAASGPHLIALLDMASDQSVEAFGAYLAEQAQYLDGAVLMPPQPHAAADPLPTSDVWRDLFQTSFIGPLATLKAAITRMQPDPSVNKRAKIVIISGISSAQVLGHYATSNVIRTAWLGEAKTLAFALGSRGIHVNTLSLGGTLSPWYREAIARGAEAKGWAFSDQLAAETDNVPLGKYGQPEEVAKVVAQLLSDFSDHMTGVNLLHDGGFTRAY